MMWLHLEIDEPKQDLRMQLATWLIPIVILLSGNAYAGNEQEFVGQDFSGTYDCSGDDINDGAYSGTVTIRLVREQSYMNYGAYEFVLAVPDGSLYSGHGAAQDNMMAIYFAATDLSDSDFGTGIAKFTKTPAGKWQYTKYYFEPAYRGGNFGLQICVQQ